MLGHPDGGLVGRSWAGWLLGLVPLGYPGGGSSGLSWVGWLLGLVPLGLWGWASWLGVSGLAHGTYCFNIEYIFIYLINSILNIYNFIFCIYPLNFI